MSGINETVTYIHNTQGNIDNLLRDAIYNMTEEQVKALFLEYLDARQQFNVAVNKELVNSSDLRFAESLAALTNTFANIVNNKVMDVNEKSESKASSRFM